MKKGGGRRRRDHAKEPLASGHELLFSYMHIHHNEGGEEKMNSKSLLGSRIIQFSSPSKPGRGEDIAPISFRRQFRLVALLTLFFLLWSGQSLAQVTGQARTVARQVLPSVVTILMYDSQRRQIGSGSGFILSSRGLIATCYHVIQKADSARVQLQSGDVYDVVGCMEFDIDKDFAIIKINAVELPAVKLGNSNRLEIAENMIAVGAPLGLSGSVTTGIVSQIRPKGEYRVIQHTAPISPGSSGGPLVNEYGQVVGVNSFSLQGGQSIYFALPINYVRAAWENSRGQLISLRQLRAAVQRQAEKTLELALEQVIKERFTLYSDPDGLFSCLIRRDWQVQRADKEFKDDETFGPHRAISFMNHSPYAEKAKISGWLSEGVRLSLHLPPAGKEWKMEWAKKWQSMQFQNMLRGYSRQRATAVQVTTLGNAPVQYLSVEGESPQISKKELALLYVGIHRNCLMMLEVTMPADKADELDFVNTMLFSTFKAGWIK
jgi:hypothetical protein